MTEQLLPPLLPDTIRDAGPQPRFISPTGQPSFFPDQTSFGSIGTRLQLNSAALLDPTDDETDFLGYALSSIAGWAAHDNNQAAADKIDLGIEDSPLGFVTADGQRLIPYNEAKGTDVPDLVSAGVRHIMDTRGFNTSVLEGISAEEGMDAVRYFLLVNRLQDNLISNTDGWIETAAGWTGTFATDILSDPVNLAAIGFGTALRTAGKHTARKATERLAIKSGSASGLSKTERFVLSAAGRAERNGTIIGSSIDNTWTRNHAALLMALESGTFVAGFDVVSQAKEARLTNAYLDPDAEWWDPTRTAFSALAGGGLAWGLSTAFTQGALRRADARNSRLLSPTNQPLPKVEGDTRIFANQLDALHEADVVEDAAEVIISSHVDSFTRPVRNQIRQLVSSNEHDSRELALFMMKKPTEREIYSWFGRVDDEKVVSLTAAVADAEKAYTAAIDKATARDKKLSNIEHYNHKKKIEKLKVELEQSQNPLRPQGTEMERLAKSVVVLRNKYLDMVESGASAKDTDAVRRELLSIDRKLEETAASITGHFRETEQALLTEFVAGFDRPRNTELSPAQQADLLSTLTITGSLDFPLHNPNLTSRFLNNRAFSFLSSIGTRRHDIEQAAQKSPIFGLVANLVYPLAHTSSSMVPGRDSVLSLGFAYSRNRRQVEMNLSNPTRKLYKRAKGDHNILNAEFREALKVAAGMEATDDELIAELAFGFRKLYDDFGKYGTSVGALDRLQDDFVHIVLNPEAANKHMDRLVELLTDDYKKVYKRTSPDTPLHRGTLIRAGIVDIEGNVSEDLGTSIRIRSRKDLDDLVFSDDVRALARYDELLDDTLQDHADRALHNKVNAIAGREITDEAAARGETSAATRAPRTDRERRIDQEFFLKDEILDTGAVELNPILTGLSYIFGTGNRIAKQDVVNRITGRQDITWDGLMTLAERNLASNFKNTQAGRSSVNSLMDTLRDAERDISGRNIALGEGEIASRVVAANVRNVAGAAINPGIGIAMSSVELPAMMVELSNKFGTAKSVRSAIRFLSDQDLSQEQLRALGKSLDFVMREHRHMAAAGFTDDTIAFTLSDRLAAPFRQIGESFRGQRAPRSLRGSENRAINTVTSSTEALSDLSRLGSFEEFLTNRARSFIGYMHLNQTLQYLPKLTELASKNVDPTDLRSLKRAAREAGFGRKWTLAQEFMDNGLTGPQTLTGLQLLRNAGVTDLADAHMVNKALVSITDPAERRIAREAYNKTVDYAVRMVDNIIVNPSVWDRPAHSQHPMLQMVNMFLSYPRGFRSNRLRPVADRGMSSIVFWSGFYLTGELINRQVQAMVFKSASPSQLLEMWEQEPDLMLLRGIGSVPFLGPYQNALINGVAKALGSETTVQLGGSPGLGITSRTVNDVIDVARASVNPDKEIDINILHRLEKIIAPLNWVPVRATQSVLENTVSD